jgi:signal transduction histidine kinase/CheY-like chemotaxis protein
MDVFSVETGSSGTTIRLGKALPPRATAFSNADLQNLTRRLAAAGPADAVDEVRLQNQEMLLQLGELQARQEELSRLNQELHDTNRGVVALYAELDERADHLRRADELKSKFLSNMSHEFRTPLNSILALSRLLLSNADGPLTAEQEKQVHFIRKSAESLTELVNDLLDLAKVEAGKTVVSPQEFTADSLFGALRGMLRPLLVGDSVALVFETPDDVPPLVTDEGKVSQILRNFISNAIKFTDQGEVRIWAEADRDTETVTFSVRDTGIGIAEEDVEVIFQEFGQVSHPGRSRIKGTGLGLPLSRKLAELLGGKIDVKSALGQGSVFSVTVPRTYRRDDELVDLDDWQVRPGRVPVLVVEDDAADAFTIERILEPSRYQALSARTVAAAKRAFEQFQPAAVLLDVVLLGDESWRLIIDLKQREATHDVPLVVVSSTRDDRKAFNLGADEFLGKPVDPVQLIGLLDRLTGHQSTTKVLLVDDQEVTRYLVRQLLPRGIYDLTEASTGEDGLASLRDSRPDVVLLDLNMPTMDGFQFLERVASSSLGGTVPAIVLTSMVLEERDRARLAQAAQIMSKSDLSASTLTRAIEAVIEQRTKSVAS